MTREDLEKYINTEFDKIKKEINSNPTKDSKQPIKKDKTK